MTLTLSQLTDDLSATGLVSADALAALEHALPPEVRPKEAHDLISALVRCGHLTRTQAASALEGHARELVYGEYVVLDQLDGAGATRVCKAQHRRLKRIVALRLFSQSILRSAESVTRFHEVVQAAARLVHPNVVATQDAGEAAGVHFVVMEFVDGHNLAAVSRERGPLPIADAVDYVLQAARGLAFAHERGVVHGDVKPSNLLLNREETVKVLEVGLSRLNQLPGEGPTEKVAFVLPAALTYLAPEQRLDGRRCDARSDVYSLGCVLYTLLAGRPLTQGLEPGGLSNALRSVRQDLPEALGRILERMTAIRPEDRFETMKHVVTDLESFAVATAKTAAGPDSVQGPPAGDAELLKASVAAQSAAQPGPVAVLDKSKYFMAKLIGGVSATIIAPVVVALVLKCMDNPPPAAPDARAATTASQVSGDKKTLETVSLPHAPETIPAVKPESPAVAEMPWGDWFNVIPAIYKPLDELKRGDRIGANRWELHDDGLHYVSDGKAGRLRLPVEIRGSDVEFDIDFTALDDKAAFVVSVPFANGFVWVNFGGNDRVDLAGKRQYPLTVTKGQRMTINLRLVHNQESDDIVGSAGGKEIFRWKGQGQDFALPYSRQTIPDGKTTTLWCPPASIVFHRYCVRGRNGSVALTRHGSAPPIARFPFGPAAARAHQAAWANYLGEPVVFVNSIGMKFVLIPPGEFQMGLSPAEYEILAKLDDPSAARLKEQLAPHKVVITRPFYLATTETTIEQYRKFVIAAEYTTQSERRGAKVNWHAPGYPHKLQFPVTDVNFQDMAAMCNWLNDSDKLPRAYDKLGPQAARGPQYRIPTEAEWEFACRAGTQTMWWFGNDAAQGNEAAWMGREEKPVAPSVVIGGRRANPFGLFDMHGNVWETCQDVFDANAYKGSAIEDPAGPGGTGVHVNRGGSAAKAAAWSSSAMRVPNRLGETGNLTGFRVLREF